MLLHLRGRRVILHNKKLRFQLKAELMLLFCYAFAGLKIMYPIIIGLDRLLSECAFGVINAEQAHYMLGKVRVHHKQRTYKACQKHIAYMYPLKHRLLIYAYSPFDFGKLALAVIAVDMGKLSFKADYLPAAELCKHKGIESVKKALFCI